MNACCTYSAVDLRERINGGWQTARRKRQAAYNSAIRRAPDNSAKFGNFQNAGRQSKSLRNFEISFLLDKIIQPTARVMMDSSLEEHLTIPLSGYDHSVYNRIADALSEAPVQSAYVDYFDAQFYFYLKLDHDIDLSFSCFCESDDDGDTDDDIMLSLEFKTRKGELIRSDSMFLEQLVEALDDIFRTLD